VEEEVEEEVKKYLHHPQVEVEAEVEEEVEEVPQEDHHMPMEDLKETPPLSSQEIENEARPLC